MKFIYFTIADIDAAWQRRADAAQNDANAKADGKDRLDYINSKSAIWRDCKPLLEKLSHGKCWYTEAKDKVSYWEVDHYRPKKLYPWLAFDWKNYRLCGGKPNRKKTDEFALEDEAVRASDSTADLSLERPLLLDPLILSDPALLTFKADGEPTCAKPSDLIATKRVQETVTTVELNSALLCEARREKWRKCERKIKRLRDLVEQRRHMNNEDAIQFSSDLCQDLVELFNPEAEFTATAKACAAELQAEQIVELAREIHKAQLAQTAPRPAL